MPASPTVPVSKLIELKADAVAYRERISAEDPKRFTTLEDVVAWVQTELGLNLAPLFESTVNAIREDIMPVLSDHGDAIDELVDETGDQLTEETSLQIITVFQQGRAICNTLEAMAKNVDAMTRTRIGKAIKLYRTTETAVREVVEMITMEPDADDGEADEAEAPDAEQEDAAEGGDEGGDVEQAAADGGEG